MPASFSGGCACGAVRYECTGEPLFALNCHCRDCQRESGSAFAAVLGVPRAAFRLTRGSPKHFDLNADSAYTTRPVLLLPPPLCPEGGRRSAASGGFRRGGGVPLFG